ncbi:exopolyphosphatase PRUNE1 isoform X2 [Bicyclus anynana]|uniref:Exopolyphosphatase PRUNE1 isoform X2 n=1 Tax=Bicyclus anynana TaxID=110368 RepID=A0ABM3M3H6_BICAN|nr:exopolyphosphatase PRUNE1 isoform X2 [Bicyclus anynana]
MEEYFASTPSKLKTNDYSSITLVLGNESCDLDSAVSAIVYAVFLHWQHNTFKGKVCTASKRTDDCKEDIFVPILDVNREDFPLKTEVVFALAGHEIYDKDLVFSNDIDMTKLMSEGKAKVTLVDHHTLASKYNHLAPYVTEIIDHRPLDRTYWTYNEDVRSTIELVGSCCTLVAQRIRDLSALVGLNGEFFTLYPDMTDLLYSCIVLDTVNFSKEVNKATQHDVEIVNFLEDLLNIDQREEQRKAKVDRLLEARRNVSQLTAAQLLRKDLKIFEDILVPSFPVLVKEFLSKPDSLEAVTEALSSRKCSLGLLLGMDLRGGHQRDCAVISPDDKLAKAEWSSPSFELVSELGVNHYYFKQMNLSAFRKQYVPAITEFLYYYKE